jgi:hypothetical protein
MKQEKKIQIKTQKLMPSSYYHSSLEGLEKCEPRRRA